MKDYIGILISVIYAIAFRVFVEFRILEINSFTYLIIVPVIVGYIPFFLNSKTFVDSKLKSILFPVCSVLLFLLIAFLTRLEDLGCFILLLPPYLLISVIVNLAIRYFIKAQKEDEQNSSKMTKNGILVFMFPLLLGHLEKYIEKKESTFESSQKVTINSSREKVWNQLLSVPDLTNYIENSTYNYLGFPNPVKSEYNQSYNTRFGYFSNGIILNEKVIQSKKLEKLSFRIDVQKSYLEKSQTFKHILQNKNVVFNSITYELKYLSKSKTELTLSCQYTIQSNIPKYGEFWSKKIIIDFEDKLVNALKKIIEE